jgi:hypothetical protein
MAATRITTQDIKDAAVTTAKILDANVTFAKLALAASEPGIIDSGSGLSKVKVNYSNFVATGSDGQVLAKDSGEASGLKWVPTTTGTAVFSEVPSGTVDGVNAAFTLANTPAANTLRVYKNGIRQKAGSGNDYQLATATITFEAGNLPQTGDVLLADYSY